MSDEDIIKLWKQGYSLDKIIIKAFGKTGNKKDIYNKHKNHIETIILKWQKEGCK